MANYDRNTTKWAYSGADSAYLIKDLPTDNFICIMNWIRDPSHRPHYKEFITFMEEEAKLRKVLAFASGEAYPDKRNGKFVKVEPA